MSYFNNTTTTYTTGNYSPSFSWQVGYQTPNLNIPTIQFRATIRPVNGDEAYSRIPSPQVLYEETGLLLNSITNLGNWNFALSKNISISGGPYRSYEVVVEAHDAFGNTSAGNTVGQTGEINWTAFPQGYDIIVVNNPRFTGFELADNIPTQFDETGAFLPAIGTAYDTEQFMGPNGEITINFNNVSFPSGIVGGYLYVSSTPFPKSGCFDSRSSYWGTRITPTKFNFDAENPGIYAPNAARKFRGSPYVFVSVSFYDQMDLALSAHGNRIDYLQYVSNNAYCFNDAYVGGITIGSGNVRVLSVTTTGYPSISPQWLIGINGSGLELGRFSTNGTSNIPSNTTTIFYIVWDTGVPTNFTQLYPGGFGSGTYVFTSCVDGQLSGLIPIYQLTTGSPVICPIINNWDYFNDQWRGASFLTTGGLDAVPITGWATGTVTRIEPKLAADMVYTKVGTGGPSSTNTAVAKSYILSTGQPILCNYKSGGFYYFGFIVGNDIGSKLLSSGNNYTGTLLFGANTIDGTPFLSAMTGVTSLPLITGYSIEVSPYRVFYIGVPATGQVPGPLNGWYTTSVATTIAHSTVYS